MSSRAKGIIFLVIKLAVAGAIIAWLVASGKLKLSTLTPVLEHGGRLVACALCLLAIPLVGSLRWHMLLGVLGFRVSYLRVLHLNLVGVFFNTFSVGYVGGDVVKAYYAACDQPRERRAEAITSVVFDRLTGLMGLLTLTLIVMASRPGLLVEGPQARSFQVVAIVLLSALAAALGFFLLTFSRRVRENAWLAERIERLPLGKMFLKLYRAVAVYRTRPWTMLAALGLSLVAHILNISVFWHLAQALDFPPIAAADFAFCIAVGVAVSSFGLPMGIGVGQVVFGVLLAMFLPDNGKELGAGLATLQQATLIVNNVALGLPAFLLVRKDSARVKAEMAADESAAAEQSTSGV